MVNLTAMSSRGFSANNIDIWRQIRLGKNWGKNPLSNPVFLKTYVFGPSTSQWSHFLWSFLCWKWACRNIFLFYFNPYGFNSRWTCTFLTSSLYLQGQSLNSSLLPPSVHFIFHLSSEVVSILSMVASAVLISPSKEQSALLGSFVLHAPKCNIEVSILTTIESIFFLFIIIVAIKLHVYSVSYVAASQCLLIFIGVARN